MKVKWTESVDIPEQYWDQMLLFGKKHKTTIDYKGEVVSSVSKLGDTYFVVLCQDDKFREVLIKDAVPVNHKPIPGFYDAITEAHIKEVNKSRND